MAVDAEKKELNPLEVKSFINLLADSDEKIINLMAQQISKLNDASLKAIEQMTEESENEALQDNWYHASKLSLISQIQDWKSSGDLEQGLFLIARLRNPGLEIESYQQQLDSYARRVGELVTSSSSSDEILAALNQVLFEEEMFMGNQNDYYDIDNNFLHTVLERKTGNPIMLSSVYILVARRLGIEIRGIGTPGHFIVQFEDRFFDPFFKGREVTADECIMRAQELNVYWREEYLEPIDDCFIIARSIRNLIAIYKKLNEFDKAADATNILKLV